MGMYTEVFFRAEVDEYAHRIIAELGYGVKEDAEGDAALAALLACERWPHIFTGSSAYFPQGNHFNIGIKMWGVSPERYVSFRSSLKNYDGEIEAFFAWVTPHVVVSGPWRSFIGYSLYEEAIEPTLYYAGPED